MSDFSLFVVFFFFELGAPPVLTVRGSRGAQGTYVARAPPPPPPPFSFRPPGASDHYTHVVEGAYDWHAMDQPNFDAAGRYAGNLVRDDALAFIEKVSGSANTQPFFL